MFDPQVSNSGDPIRGTGEKAGQSANKDAPFEILKEMAPMLTIEEDHGTYTATPRQHNGYYAGDFSARSRNQSTTASARTDPRPPTFATASRRAG